MVESGIRECSPENGDISAPSGLPAVADGSTADDGGGDSSATRIEIEETDLLADSAIRNCGSENGNDSSRPGAVERSESSDDDDAVTTPADQDDDNSATGVESDVTEASAEVKDGLENSNGSPRPSAAEYSKAAATDAAQISGDNNGGGLATGIVIEETQQVANDNGSLWSVTLERSESVPSSHASPASADAESDDDSTHLVMTTRSSDRPPPAKPPSPCEAEILHLRSENRRLASDLAASRRAVRALEGTIKQRDAEMEKLRMGAVHIAKAYQRVRDELKQKKEVEEDGEERERREADGNRQGRRRRRRRQGRRTEPDNAGGGSALKSKPESESDDSEWDDTALRDSRPEDDSRIFGSDRQGSSVSTSTSSLMAVVDEIFAEEPPSPTHRNGQNGVVGFSRDCETVLIQEGIEHDRCDRYCEEVATLCQENLVVGRLLGTGRFSCAFEVTLAATGRDESSIGEGEGGTPPEDEGELAESSSSIPAPLVLRRLSPSALEDPDAVRAGTLRLAREAALLTSLPRHENVVGVQGVCEGTFLDALRSLLNSGGEGFGYFFVVEKMCATLERRIYRWKHEEQSMLGVFLKMMNLGGGRNSVGERELASQKQAEAEYQHCRSDLLTKRLRVAVGVAEGLLHLHRHGIVHGDLRPSKVGFVDDGPSTAAKIFELGSAREAEGGDGEDHAALVIGGRRQRSRPPRPSLPTDVRSFGTLLWEVSSLDRPHDRRSPAGTTWRRNKQARHLRLDPHWPDELQDLIRGCWDDDLGRRPDMGEVMATLVGLVGLKEKAPVEVPGADAPAACNGLVGSPWSDGNETSGRSDLIRRVYEVLGEKGCPTTGAA